LTDYSKFRKSADMIDWMRTAQAEHFTKQLHERMVEAHENLLATCAKSTDPKVTSAATKWNELMTLTTFFRNARNEQVDE
jgi:hypothetical protein